MPDETTQQKYERWVADQQPVIAHYAYPADDPGTRAAGIVVAYTDRPTVTIRREDGTQMTWIADLCTETAPDAPVKEPADGDNGAIVFAAKCSWATKYSEADRRAGLPDRDVRYCNMVPGHEDDHDYVSDDDPRSYESATRKIRDGDATIHCELVNPYPPSWIQQRWEEFHRG